jgi:hypothetical protein
MGKSAAKEKLLAAVEGLWPAGKGSIRKYQRKCKKKDCPQCKSGEGHPVWELTYYKDGKQRSKHIPCALVGEVKQALENGRKIEALLIEVGLEYIEELRAKQ